MELRPVCYPWQEAPQDMQSAARTYEGRFGVHFDELMYFSKELFSELHRVERDPTEVLPGITVASRADSTILAEMELLGNVANTKEPNIEARKAYFDAVLRIYRKLPLHPEDAMKDTNTLCVGPEREGRILAQALGCLPEGRSLHPHAKRILFKGGLVVGLGSFEMPKRFYLHCVVIDSAIASGATLIAVIEKLRPFVSSFHVYSVHGPYEGLRAIVRFGELSGVKVEVTAGHATVGMNEHYYAVDGRDRNSLVLGDVGDTISDLYEGSVRE